MFTVRKYVIFPALISTGNHWVLRRTVDDGSMCETALYSRIFGSSVVAYSPLQTFNRIYIMSNKLTCSTVYRVTRFFIYD